MEGAMCVVGLVLVLMGMALGGCACERGRQVGWGDLGDGRYRNPVLKADFSDPDVVRVGSDFYMVASDFHFMGMQVLHSKDLVNWEVIGQVFSRLGVDKRYDEMRGYADGTWAPSIRFHEGNFYVYVCTPTEGLLMWEARDAAGPWSEVTVVKRVAGWEDPCPFWDEDGKAYLVHSRVGAGPLVLHRMSEDGKRLLDEGVEIYRGKVAEGPKVYRRGGWYYISLPEGGVSGGEQVVLRAKNLYGPWERREVLGAGSPHQGGLVEAGDGTWWFLGFKSTGWLGRVDYLEPVKWGADGWPVFGDEGKGVSVWRKPWVAGGAEERHVPAVGEEFELPALRPIWQWNHNPVAGAWSLTERPGYLRLKALPAESLTKARDTLTQKLWDEAGRIEVTLSTENMAEGQRAGVAFESGVQFGWIGVEVKDGVKRIVSQAGPKEAPPRRGEKRVVEEEPVIAGPVVKGDVVYLRAEYGRGGLGWFSYSLDGREWVRVSGETRLRFLSWKGARAGLFSYGPKGGAADFDRVKYVYWTP